MFVVFFVVFIVGVILGFSRQTFMLDCCVTLSGDKLHEFDVVGGFLHINYNSFVDNYSALCNYCICLMIGA